MKAIFQCFFFKQSVKATLFGGFKISSKHYFKATFEVNFSKQYLKATSFEGLETSARQSFKVTFQGSQVGVFKITFSKTVYQGRLLKPL